jgi:Leucine-rich repeat (LRR) protein
MNTVTNFTYLINLEKTIDPFMENKIKKHEEKKKRKLAKTDINLDILKEGLYELGVTHDKYHHAYLSINISGKELLSIGGINKFAFLQNVNVSNNNLTSLDQLSGLRHMVKLIASNNKIIDMFDFEYECIKLDHLLI